MKILTNIEDIAELVKAGIDLKTSEAAVYLNLSPRTLEKYRYTGEGPRFYKYGRMVRYAVTDLEEWRSARHHNSTSEVCK